MKYYFDNKNIELLQQKRSDFETLIFEEKNPIESYRLLMIETRPYWFSGWISNDYDNKTNKDLAKLLCTMTGVFKSCYSGAKQIFLGNSELEKYAKFHESFIENLVFCDNLEVVDKLILVIDIKSNREYIIDTTKFVINKDIF